MTLERIRTMENPNVVLTHCPICLCRQVDSFSERNGFAMDRCADCGLIFCNPYPTSEQLHHCYNAPWTLIENDLFKQTFEKRVNIFLPRVKLIQEHKTHGSLLDIGSSVGIFAEALFRSQSPLKVTCCDLNAVSCQDLQKRYPNMEVIHSDFMQLPEKRQFDVITFWDTVEHIVDLPGMFQKLGNLLSPDGILAFSTPNTHSFEWLIAGTAHPQLTPPTHVNLLNEKSIRILLEKNKFQLVDTKTLNSSLDITFVKNLIQNKEADLGRVGVFLAEELFNPDFIQLLEPYLVKHRRAGNIVTLAKKM